MIVIDNERIDIGLKKRIVKEGPELDLVEEFIEEIPKLFRTKKKLALFVEPLIEGSYPDIVITEFNPSIVENWKETRNQLSVTDLKVFETIRAYKGMNASELFQKTNHDYKTLMHCIEKLYDAGLIERKMSKWKSLPLQEIYSVNRIISVEAKMKEWKTLLNQADANRWFSSESYALSSVKTPRETTINKFKDYGVGLFSLSNQKLIKLNEAEKQSLPKSYMSWMFNEWIGRYVSKG